MVVTDGRQVVRFLRFSVGGNRRRALPVFRSLAQELSERVFVSGQEQPVLRPAHRRLRADDVAERGDRNLLAFHPEEVPPGPDVVELAGRSKRPPPSVVAEATPTGAVPLASTRTPASGRPFASVTRPSIEPRCS